MRDFKKFLTIGLMLGQLSQSLPTQAGPTLSIPGLPTGSSEDVQQRLQDVNHFYLWHYIFPAAIAGIIDNLLGIKSGATAAKLKDLTGRDPTKDTAAIGEYVFAKSGDSRRLRLALNQQRAANGQPPNPDGCEPHHIVPSGDNRRDAKAARDAIEGCIGINDAENGIYLPGPKKGKECEGQTYHRSIHDDVYYRKIAKRLGDARMRGGCQQVRSELDLIKELLKNGEFL